MILSDLLRPEAVLVPLEAPNSEKAISALVDALVLEGGEPADRAALKAAIMAREAVGSTGVGGGVAIPHACSIHIKAPLMAVGRTAAPIDFQAPDGNPVKLVFLIAVPTTAAHIHLPVLTALGRVASDKGLLRQLINAPSPEKLYGLLSSVPV
ncbi:MAG: PTS sugar transporter subunit IIA [Elusimicrobia bacterium]|nr:PTS sugar transporter subunit IIA [Elusimicrobiota bacterium]